VFLSRGSVARSYVDAAFTIGIKTTLSEIDLNGMCCSSKDVVGCQTDRLKLDTPLGGDILSKLQGRIAVITGGNSGIGLATAVEFVAEGAYVFITGRRQKELDAAAALIGRNVTAVQGDVSNLADLDRLYAQVAKEKGRVDIVFANAGIPFPLR
jgi:hypothetical protein